MHSKVLLGITILAFAAAGCAGGAANPAVAGGSAPASAPAIDATPVHTLSGGSVTSARSGVPVTARDWNCPRCYK